MKLNQKGLLIVLSGPSGVGKATVRKALFEMKNHNFVYSISSTTRKPRLGEQEGKDYYFLTKEEFELGIKNNKFLEWAKFIDNYYGTSRKQVEDYLKEGKEVFLEIEVEGATQLRKKKFRNAVFIFLVPPEKKVLYERLKKRGTESADKIQQRIMKADKEFPLAHKYDYIVVNDDVFNAADRIIAIIRAEHAKTKRSIRNYLKILENDGYAEQ
ncbi:Guanylate kinase [Candidatus Phytoplasma australiense]|uniref:Guanylate kinase n=2 Tax=Phytoplasma australiense TaxID=59748 RepID=B1V908_PHYAS|nr:guanylate kinase [Candidatus Phytoplasma australiense]AGL90712.1 Guanylate kinase [Strawberry lethal yellows phytoplasma (CPA) str. NZSb11]CAM11440.1 Guanylate kinase [Candidatus Phytoplasma australiense]